MLLDFLRLLGFNETETKVYMVLLNGSNQSAPQISRQADIPRTTAYSALDSLVEKGVAKARRDGSTTLYSASSPDSFQEIVRKEQNALEEKRLVAKEVVNLVTPHLNTSKIHIPKMEFYEGQKQIETMLYANLPDWEASMALDDSILWGYQDPSFVKHYKTWLEHHWERKNKYMPQMQIRLFSNESKIEKGLKDQVENRFIRAFSGQVPFTSSVWILGEYIVMIRTDKEPHYAFQLKDAAFASNIKLFISFIWSNLNPE